MKRPTTLPKFENRVRFNWGYHDGASAYTNPRASLVRNGFGTRMDTHPDRPYSKGYEAGYRDKQAGVYQEDSTAAWSAAGIPA